MKNIIYSLVLMCLFLSACKKDHSKESTPATATTKQKVSLNVGFSQSVTTFSTRPLSTNSLTTNSITADTALTNHIGILYYMVYDSAGNSVQTVKQLSTDSTFGHFSEILPAGKYTIAVAGGQRAESIPNNPNITLQLYVQQANLSGTYLFYGNPNANLFLVQTFLGDTFFKLMTVTVGSGPISQNVALDRISSIVKVNINDAIPANIDRISITIMENTVADNYYISDGHTEQTFTNDTQMFPVTSANFVVPASAIGTTNFQMQTNLLYSGPFSVEITAGNHLTGGGVTKTITGIPGAPGKETLLEGNLFGGNGLNNGNTSTQFTADTTWKSTTTIGF